jgi:hypothetical protein
LNRTLDHDPLSKYALTPQNFGGLSVFVKSYCSVSVEKHPIDGKRGTGGVCSIVCPRKIN